MRTQFANLASVACLTVLIGNTPAPCDPPASAPAIIPASSKLDIDPTETIPIFGWWSNGKELLLILENGAFRFWDQPNRFFAPTKSGRWDRQNYRTFWIEPYVDKKNPGVMPARIRCAMRRSDGVVFADVGSALGMRQMNEAPTAPEDLYVGRWSGPGGSLTLSADGKYELLSSPSSTNDPALVSRASHSGTWTFDGQYIRLISNRSTQNPIICAVVDRPSTNDVANKSNLSTTDQRAKKSNPANEALTTPIGELRRMVPVTPSAPIVPAAPAAPIIPPAASPVP